MPSILKDVRYKIKDYGLILVPDITETVKNNKPFSVLHGFRIYHFTELSPYLPKKWKGTLDYHLLKDKLSKEHVKIRERELLKPGDYPARVIYNFIKNKLQTIPKDEHSSFVFTTLKMTFPRIFEPVNYKDPNLKEKINKHTVKLAYIFANIVKFAHDDGYLTDKDKNHLITELDMNLNGFLQASNQTAPSWEKIKKKVLS